MKFVIYFPFLWLFIVLLYSFFKVSFPYGIVIFKLEKRNYNKMFIGKNFKSVLIFSTKKYSLYKDEWDVQGHKSKKYKICLL